MAAPAASNDSRARVYAGLARRNGLVRMLRWLLPLIGVLVLLVVLGVMVVNGLAQRFGISNIRIDRNNLVVDTPELTSTMSDGTVYALSAQSAKVLVTQTDLVDLANATFSATPPSGVVFSARADEARLQTTDQTVEVAGTVHVDSTDGLTGTMDQTFVDMRRWHVVASGGVEFSMPDGIRLRADTMIYDRETSNFKFRNIRLTLPLTPGGTP